MAVADRTRAGAWVADRAGAFSTSAPSGCTGLDVSSALDAVLASWWFDGVAELTVPASTATADPPPSSALPPPLVGALCHPASDALVFATGVALAVGRCSPRWLTHTRKASGGRSGTRPSRNAWTNSSGGKVMVDDVVHDHCGSDVDRVADPTDLDLAVSKSKLAAPDHSALAHRPSLERDPMVAFPTPPVTSLLAPMREAQRARL
jgi:hypothetical protein